MVAELCAAAAAFWGVGVRKTERKGGEQNEETPLVLKRARGRALGFFPALATAAVRWRPAGARCCMARRGEDTARGKSGGEGSGATRGRPQQAGGGSGSSFGGGWRVSALALRGTERQAGGGRQRTSLQFQKFQGLYSKTKITFNLGLRWKSAQHDSCSLFQDLQL